MFPTHTTLRFYPTKDDQHFTAIFISDHAVLQTEPSRQLFESMDDWVVSLPEEPEIEDLTVEYPGMQERLYEDAKMPELMEDSDYTESDESKESDSEEDGQPMPKKGQAMPHVISDMARKMAEKEEKKAEKLARKMAKAQAELAEKEEKKALKAAVRQAKAQAALAEKEQKKALKAAARQAKAQAALAEKEEKKAQKAAAREAVWKEQQNIRMREMDIEIQELRLRIVAEMAEDERRRAREAARLEKHQQNMAKLQSKLDQMVTWRNIIA